MIALAAGGAPAGCTGGPGVEAARAAPIAGVDASSLIAPGAGRRAFEVFDASGAPLGVEVQTSTDADDDASWTTVTTTEGGRPREAGYRLSEDGSVLLAWSRSPKDTDPDGPARLYVFEPALRMYPPRLEAGEAFEDRTRMTERRAGDERKVSLRGSAVRRARLIAPGEAGWVFGDAGGRAVLGELVIEVGPARAVRRTATLLDDAGGTVREEIDYAITVLGLRFKHERTALTPRREDPESVTGSPR
jgi:hypothetical protein